MRAKRATKEFVEGELPYKLLISLYNDSRASLKKLGRELNISYHTIAKALKDYEEKYKIIYTLDLDEKALGFPEGRLITIKFEKIPNIDFLKKHFENEIFVQDAYLATGDFDLLLYVIGLTQLDFRQWLFKQRVKLSEYKPQVKVSTVNAYMTGFFPLRDEMIDQSNVINNTEKKILKLLNNDSRMKLRDIVNMSKTTQMRVIYTIEKFKERGIIKNFTTLTQNPDKRLFYAYSLVLTPNEDYDKLDKTFLNIIVSEDLHEIVNDYCLIASTNGGYDTFFVCVFKNGEIMSKRGYLMTEQIYSSENPKIEKALLTDIIIGKWPFHLENYDKLKQYIRKEKEII